jgi:hypothetical protein
MTTKIDGTNGIIFPDNTTQSTAGVLSTSTQLCKAWVNYNGVAGSIRASYNVSSVTINSAGDYTINFTNSLGDANYATVCTVADQAGGNIGAKPLTSGSYSGSLTLYSATQVRIAGSGSAMTLLSVTVFR